MRFGVIIQPICKRFKKVVNDTSILGTNYAIDQSFLYLFNHSLSCFLQRTTKVIFIGTSLARYLFAMLGLAKSRNSAF